MGVFSYGWIYFTKKKPDEKRGEGCVYYYENLIKLD